MGICAEAFACPLRHGYHGQRKAAWHSGPGNGLLVALAAQITGTGSPKNQRPPHGLRKGKAVISGSRQVNLT